MTSTECSSGFCPQTRSFYVALPCLASRPAMPALLDYKGSKVAVLFTHEAKNTLKAVYKAARAQFNCGTSGLRARMFASISDITGGRVFMCDDVLHGLPEDAAMDRPLYDTLAKLAAEACASPIAGATVVTDSMLFGFSQRPDETLPFHHYSLPICDATPLASHATKTLLEKAFHRYLPVLMPRLVSTLINGDGGIDGALASLTLMDACLKKSTYGDKALGTVSWLIRIVEDVRDTGNPFASWTDTERWAACAQYLCWVGLHPDAHEAVVCPAYHQANTNVLDMLASANSEAAMVAMLSDRFDPTKYRRPDTTVPVSASAVAAAITKLGDFVNTVMTHADLEAMEHCVTLRAKPVEEAAAASASPDGSLAAFGRMFTNAAGGKKSAANTFATRCAATVPALTTMTELITYLREHPHSTVTMKSAAGHACYAVKTTLDPAVLKVPHMWAFTQTLIACAGTKVTHILPMFQYISGYSNALFVLEGERPTLRGNCCFPEFLSYEHERELRRPFEMLNTTTNVHMPPGPMAYGVGVSATNRDGKLFAPIALCIDGTSVTIDRI